MQLTNLKSISHVGMSISELPVSLIKDKSIASYSTMSFSVFYRLLVGLYFKLLTNFLHLLLVLLFYLFLSFHSELLKLIH